MSRTYLALTLVVSLVALVVGNGACNRGEELDVSPEDLAEFDVFQPSEKIDEGSTESEIDDDAFDQNFAETEISEDDSLDEDGDPRQNAAKIFKTIVGEEKRKVDFAGVKAKAEKGDAAAQCELGYYYETGLGVERDWKQAFAWYEKSANQGHGDGLAALGVCYQFGIGTKIDLKKAVELLQKGVEQDNVKAIGAMGYLLITGFSPKRNMQFEGEELDTSEFQEFVRQRLINYEDSDCPDVVWALALAYGAGFGVEQNEEKRDKYYEKYGTLLGQTELKDQRAVAFLKFGRCVALCPIDVFQFTAVEFYTRAADQGLADAQLNKAYFYMEVKDVEESVLEKDVESGMRLLELSAEQNNVIANSLLGDIYNLGEIVPQDHSKALEYYKKSEENGGSWRLYFQIAVCYFNLDNKSEYAKYLDKSLEAGDPFAKFAKGCEYAGSGDSEKTFDGFMLICEAADAGVEPALDFIRNELAEQGPKPNEYRNVQFIGVLEKHIRALRDSGKSDLADEYQNMKDQYLNLADGGFDETDDGGSSTVFDELGGGGYYDSYGGYGGGYYDGYGGYGGGSYEAERQIQRFGNQLNNSLAPILDPNFRIGY